MNQRQGQMPTGLSVGWVRAYCDSKMQPPGKLALVVPTRRSRRQSPTGLVTRDAGASLRAFHRAGPAPEAPEIAGNARPSECKYPPLIFTLVKRAASR
jgi:hypothetical protein